MNKKLFFGLFAATGMLFATSCSDDELQSIQSGNEAQVSFTLGLEGGIASRAISDGMSVDKLVYAVYDADNKLITTIAGSDNGEFVKDNAFQNGLTENVNITLAKGQTYTVVFWAQDETCNAYTVTTETDGIKVAVDYNGKNNDETRDAFFKAETFKVSGNAQINVTLKRPFAQVNVGVTKADWDAAVASGIDVEESKVVIKNAATGINLLDGTVTGEAAVEYAFATIPAKFDAEEVLTVDVDGDGTISEDENYKYLSMSYILTAAEKTTLEADGLQFTFSPANGEDIVFDEGLHSVPVQRNWRTNILGKLLTGDIEFNIVIDPAFDNDYNYPEFEEVTNGVKYDAATKTYYLYSAAGLQWFADQTNTQNNNFNGYTVKLTSDVDLNGINWTPIGVGTTLMGTFDGGNNTISNLTVNVTDDKVAAGLFASARLVKNIKLSNVKISGHAKAGAVVGNGLCARIENCHVDGGTITSTPNSQKDDANNVGGITGYLSSEFGSATNLVSYIKDCSVKNLTITAYRDLGGIVGTVTASGTPIISNNIIDNVTIIADQLTEYAESGKAANAGKVVGRNLNSNLTAIDEENTTNNVTITICNIDENGIATVGSSEGLAYAIKNNATILNLTAGEFTANLYNIENKETLTIIGTEGTKIAFSNLQVRASQFNELKIQNCEILRMPNKAWGHVVFGSSDNAQGVYTIENCIFNGQGSQGIYINEKASGATYNVLNCTFNGDFGKEGAITIQNNADVNHTVNVKGCTFNNVTSNKIFVLYDYYGWTLNTDIEASSVEDIKLFASMGFDTILLGDGTYNASSISLKNKSITLKGVGENVILNVNQNNAVALGSFDGSKVTFENLIIKTPGGLYKGFARMEGTYKNCTFENLYFTNYGTHKFEKCNFNAGKDEHCMWTYGANKVEFDNCKFNYSDRCINVYVDNGKGNTSVDFDKCVFTAGSANSKGAVEINSSAFPQGVAVDFTGCTAPSVGEMVFISGWDSTAGRTATVTIDGTTVTAPQLPK